MVRVEWIGVSTFSTFVWDGAIGGHMACWGVETEKRLYCTDGDKINNFVRSSWCNINGLGTLISPRPSSRL